MMTVIISILLITIVALALALQHAKRKIEVLQMLNTHLRKDIEKKYSGKTRR